MLRVGVAQIDIKLGDREVNFQRVEKWMNDNYSHSNNETVVVLPEMWDVGYAIEDAAKFADPDGMLSAEFLGKLAKKHSVWFAGGSVLAKTSEGVMNRAQVINPSGEYITHYDKVHLIPLMDEHLYLKSGKELSLFDIAGVSASCVICYDIRFCEWMRLGALRGSKICFISAEWPTVRIEHWRTLLRARAIENMMFIVACNRVGNSKNTDFGGRSVILDPWGNVLYEAGDKEDGAFVDIDPVKAQEVREHLKVFEVRRPELYAE